jgi:hypothetical protein
MFDKAIEWAQKHYPKEHRHMMRLWSASWRISKPLTIIGALTISAPIAVGTFFAGKFIGTTNIYMPTPATPALNENQFKSARWEPLSNQEIIALHEAWREFPPQRVNILCAIPACADLAESIFNVATGLHWKVAYESTYMTDENGIHQGIELWSWPQAGQSEIRDKLANTIEHATNGRLLISTHENTWNGAPLPDKQMPPDFGLQFNLVIGRLK